MCGTNCQTFGPNVTALAESRLSLRESSVLSISGKEDNLRQVYLVETLHVRLEIGFII